MFDIIIVSQHKSGQQCRWYQVTVSDRQRARCPAPSSTSPRPSSTSPRRRPGSAAAVATQEATDGDSRAMPLALFTSRCGVMDSGLRGMTEYISSRLFFARMLWHCGPPPEGTRNVTVLHSGEDREVPVRHPDRGRGFRAKRSMGSCSSKPLI